MSDADDWSKSVRALCVRVCGEEVAQRGRWIADIEAVCGSPFRKLPYPVYCESGATPGRRQGCQCVSKPEPCDECVEFVWNLEEIRASEPGRPWIDHDKLVPELHPGGWEYDIRVCVGTTNVVEIDKFYGPVVAQPVRVSIEPELNSWVVERKVEDEEDSEPGTSTWVEVARFPLDGAIR